MRKHLLLAPLLALAFAGVALASEKPKDSKADAGQYVDVLQVGLPVIAGGRVVNYVFVQVRLNLSRGANAAKLREKEPYFRDALVRAAHRTPFTVPNDYQKLDVAKLKATLMQEGAAIAGAGAIRSIDVVNQAPQRQARAPRT